MVLFPIGTFFYWYFYRIPISRLVDGHGMSTYIPTGAGSNLLLFYSLPCTLKLCKLRYVCICMINRILIIDLIPLQGWGNVRSIHLKTESSLALPLYENEVAPADIDIKDDSELNSITEIKKRKTTEVLSFIHKYLQCLPCP